MMRVAGIAAVSALLAVGLAGPVGPAYAQTPQINLLADKPSKTPEEKEAEEARDKAYKESLKKIPDAKGSSDPWGGVRSDAPKQVAPKPAAKMSAGKPKTEAKNDPKLRGGAN
jgi:hypothetical protein